MALTDSLDAATQQVLALLAQLKTSNCRTVQGQDSGTADNILVNPTPSVAAYGPDLLLLIDVAYPNATTTPRVNVSGIGWLNVKRGDGSAVAIGAVAGKCLFGVSSAQGGGYEARLLLSSVAGRVRLGDTVGALTIYVNSTTGADTNTGTAAAPFATLSAAALWAQRSLDLNGNQLTFNCAGSFTQGLVINGLFVGQINAASLVFNLGSATINSVGSCFIAGAGALYTVVGGGPLSSTGTGYSQGCVLNASGGTINYSGLNFAACAQGHIATNNGGFVYCLGGYTISGNAPSHILAAPAGNIILNQNTVTLSGTPNFSNAFALAIGGTISASLATFNGAATGKRYSIDLFGSIYVGGAGVNFLPGNAAGTLVTGEGDYR